MSDTAPSPPRSQLAQLHPGATLADLFPTRDHRARPGESVLTPLAELNAVAEFDRASVARDALVALERHGYDAQSISFLAVDAHDGDVDDARTDAATMGGALRRAARWGLIGGLVGTAVFFVVSLLVGTTVGAAAGVAIGGFAAGAALGSIWGVGSHLGAGDRWGETYRAPEDSRAVVAVHGDSSIDVREARRLLVDAGAVQSYDLDRRGEHFTISDVARHR